MCSVYLMWVWCGHAFLHFLIHWLFKTAVVTFQSLILYFMWTSLICLYLVWVHMSIHTHWSSPSSMTICNTIFLTRVNISCHTYWKEHTRMLFCLTNGSFQKPEKYFPSFFHTLLFLFLILITLFWCPLCENVLLLYGFFLQSCSQISFQNRKVFP